MSSDSRTLPVETGARGVWFRDVLDSMGNETAPMFGEPARVGENWPACFSGHRKSGVAPGFPRSSLREEARVSIGLGGVDSISSRIKAGGIGNASGCIVCVTSAAPAGANLHAGDVRVIFEELDG